MRRIFIFRTLPLVSLSHLIIGVIALRLVDLKIDKLFASASGELNALEESVRLLASLGISLSLLISLVVSLTLVLHRVGRIHTSLLALSNDLGSVNLNQENDHWRVRANEPFDRLAELISLKNHDHLQRIQVLLRQRQELESMLSRMKEGVLVADSRESIRMVNRSFLMFFGLAGEPSSYTGGIVSAVFRNSRLSSIFEEQVPQAPTSPGRMGRMLTRAGLEEPDQGEQVPQAPTSPGRMGEQVPQAPTSPGASQIEVWDSRQEFFRTLDMSVAYIEPQGEILGRYLIVLHDITELVRLEKIRKDFVANVSHELKTPVTSIQGFAETLLQGGLEDPQTAEKFISIIHRQSQRMEHIITDLLLLSRVEQQHHEIRFQSASLHRLARESMAVVEAAAAGRKIVIHLEIPDDAEVLCNPFLMEQVLINLLQNGIAYGHEGGIITLSMNLSDSELIIRIGDNGPGIPRRDLPRLFERFYRVDKGRSRSQGGTGLGLAIVRHIVMAHGGQIEVDSTLGKGTEFCISIPQPPSGKKSQEQLEPTDQGA